MARYFFHVRNGQGYVRDDEGQELASKASVRDVAIVSIRALLCDDLTQGVIDLDGTVEVTDETGAPVLELLFNDAVQIRT